jgi:bacteriorhodopsin
MGLLLQRSNDALNINPVPTSDQYLLEHGSDWLWAVTAIYAVAFVSDSKRPDLGFIRFWT